MGKNFISYARADDEPFVRQLYHDLTEQGIDVWWDQKAMESRGLTFLQELRDAIEGSDRLIAVIGPNAVKSDYVRAEWKHALWFSKGVVPILREGEDTLIPHELSKFHWPDFRRERPYNEALEELLRILAEPVPPVGPFRTAVPSLPPHFLPRHDEMTSLGETVLADVQRPTVITSEKQITALQGMGGVGKSVTAAAFARATETRRAFTDGVIWLTIGQNPDPSLNLKLVGLAFGDDPVNYVDLETARARLPRILADKVCLIVLDDVWNVAHAAPFINALGPRCRLLITTRDGGLVTTLGAQEHSLDVLNAKEALELLSEWADQDVKRLPPEAEAVADECGNLPLALAIVGAMVRGKPNRWENILHKLRNADLEKIRKHFPNYPYPDILKAIQVSVEALEPDVQKRYLDFSVFPEKISIPEAVLQAFWEAEGLDEFDTQDIADTLVDKSLAQRDHAGNLILHDLQLDYVRKQVGDLPSLHDRLLEAYRLKCTNGWSTGPKDGYFFEHLAYHLVEAEHKEELPKLLLDFDWLQAKLAATDVNSLIADYDFLPEDRQLRLVQGAIRLSAHVLARDKVQLAGQLLGRLQSSDVPGIQSMLEQARGWNGGVWLRPLTASLRPPGGPLIRTIRTIEEDIGRVTAVAVTPDGKRVISASGDKTIRMWNIENGMELCKLDLDTVVTNLIVMPDGHRLLLGSGTLEIWDLESGEQLRTLPISSLLADIIGSSVALMPDGRRVFLGLYDGTLEIRDLESGQELHTLHISKFTSIALMPDGRRVLSATPNEPLKIWDLENGTELSTLKGDTIIIRGLAVTPDGRRAISGSYDDNIEIWDLETGEKLHIIKGHDDQIHAIAVTPDGRRAISGSYDGTLKVWDLESEGESDALTSHTTEVTAVAVTPDGHRAISASKDRTLKVWDLENGSELRTLKGDFGWFTAVAITPDGSRAVCGSWDYSLWVWDLESGERLATMVDENLVIGAIEGYCPEGPINVTALAVTPDGRRAVFATEHDNKLMLWDLEGGDGAHKRKIEVHAEKVIAVVVTPDGRRVVSGSDNGTLKLWDLESGSELRTFTGHTTSVTAVTVTPDGHRAISASPDHTLKLWDLESGGELRTLKANAGITKAVAIMPDGLRAIFKSVVSEYISTLEVWDAEKEKIIANFSGDSTLTVCAVAADGVTIVAGEVSGRVHFLRLEGAEAMPF